MSEFVILVVDDDAGDVQLFRRAFTKAGLGKSVRYLRSGEAVVDYLAGTPPFEDRMKHPFPNLLLVDLNMPGMDGFELLRWLQKKSFIERRLKVAVLTGSCRQQDFERSHELGADFSLNKTTDLQGLVAAIKEMVSENE